jgi:hypothetical protein
MDDSSDVVAHDASMNAEQQYNTFFIFLSSVEPVETRMPGVRGIDTSPLESNRKPRSSTMAGVRHVALRSVRDTSRST